VSDIENRFVALIKQAREAAGEPSDAETLCELVRALDDENRLLVSIFLRRLLTDQCARDGVQ
jgi:hypothetical protein